jgi:hypothetical protein
MDETTTLTDDWPTLEVLSLRYIASVLDRSAGNKTRAADKLGIDRRTLNRILARQRAKEAAAARYRQLAHDAKRTSGEARTAAPATTRAGTA